MRIHALAALLLPLAVDAGVTAGPPLVITTGESSYHAAAIFSESYAVNCYRHNANSDHAECQLLRLSGSTLEEDGDSHGTALVVASASTTSITLDSHWASSTGIVCYRDESASGKGKCKAVTLTPSTSTGLSAGSELTFTSNQVDHVQVAMLDASNAIVCYTDKGNSDYATCTSLTLSGTTLSAGTTDVINTAGSTYLSVAAFDTTTALVCYSDQSNGNHVTCNAITPSELSAVERIGPALKVNSLYATSADISIFDASSAAVCFRAEVHGWYPTCVAIKRGNSAVAAGYDTLTAGLPVLVRYTKASYVLTTAFDTVTAVVGYPDEQNDKKTHRTPALYFWSDP